METATTTTSAAISTADQARIERALQDSRAKNTRAQYRSAWSGRVAWCAAQGHATLPAEPMAVAAYLTERTDQGAAASTVRAARAAIGAAHRDAGAADPTAHDGVRRVLKGLGRQAAGRGRGQAQGLIADDVAAIIAAAVLRAGDLDELLRGALDSDLADRHNERAAIYEYDGGLPRPLATARALARLLETLTRRN